MKIIPILLSFLFLGSIATEAQNKAVRSYFRAHKHQEEATHFTLPGFLVWAGIGIARGFTTERDEKLMLKLVQKLGTTKMLVLDQNIERAAETAPLMLAALQERHGYEPMMEIKVKGEENIHIMMKGNDKRLKRLFIFVSTPEEVVMISSKTRLKYKKVQKILEELMKEENMNPKEEVQQIIMPRA